MWKMIWGRCIYKSPSGWEVHQNIRYRWLMLGNTLVQTCLNRRHPDRGGSEYVAPLVSMVKAFPGDCCLLGLGGASIPHALSQHLGTSSIVAVDNNVEVIDIAARYFNTDHIKNLTIVHQNAVDFVGSTVKTFRHVIIDLSNAEDYPEECNTDEFFINAKQLLTSDGILSVNLMGLHKKRLLFQRIRQQFNNCTLVVPVKRCDNTLIFAYNQLEPNETIFIKKMEQAYPTHRVVWDSFWGCVVG